MTNAYLFMVGKVCALIIAGIVHIFNQAINTRQAKMGATRAEFDFKRCHFRQSIRELSCSPLERCCYASACLQPVGEISRQLSIYFPDVDKRSCGARFPN